MSRVEENESMIQRTKGNFHGKTDDVLCQIIGQELGVLVDISRSLAVIADKMPTEEVKKTCLNCKSWAMDISNPRRRCSDCYDLDEWEENDGN